MSIDWATMSVSRGGGRDRPPPPTAGLWGEVGDEAPDLLVAEGDEEMGGGESSGTATSLTRRYGPLSAEIPPCVADTAGCRAATGAGDEPASLLLFFDDVLVVVVVVADGLAVVIVDDDVVVVFVVVLVLLDATGAVPGRADAAVDPICPPPYMCRKVAASCCSR